MQDPVGERFQSERDCLSLSLYLPFIAACCFLGKQGKTSVAGFETRMGDMRIGLVKPPAKYIQLHTSLY